MFSFLCVVNENSSYQTNTTRIVEWCCWMLVSWHRNTNYSVFTEVNCQITEILRSLLLNYLTVFQQLLNINGDGMERIPTCHSDNTVPGYSDQLSAENCLLADSAAEAARNADAFTALWKVKPVPVTVMYKSTRILIVHNITGSSLLFHGQGSHQGTEQPSYKL